MVRDVDAARELVHLLAEEEGLLESRERPIVLCRRRDARLWRLRSPPAPASSA